MSLAGIAISVGILIDQAVVMAENAAHHLSRRFGRERDHGRHHRHRHPRLPHGRPADLLLGADHDPLVPAGVRAVGPRGEDVPPPGVHQDVRADRRGDPVDHARAGADPDLPQGADQSENESWLVRTMIEIFKPMLSWLMDRPTLVIWLFTVIVGLGYVASTRLGREFMPPLDEGSILDMPTSVPRTIGDPGRR